MVQVEKLNELEELRLAKCEIESVRGHKYGLWSKDIDNETLIINYKRSCKKCGHIETISTTSVDESIERELMGQEQASKLVDFFINSDEETLTDENILGFLMCTVDFQSRMEIDKIYSKLISINKVYEVHNNYSENLIYNAVLSLKKIGQIPEDLFQDIYNYLNRTSEYLGKDDNNSINTGRVM